MYAFPVSPMRAACHVHIIFLYLIIFSENHRTWTSSWWFTRENILVSG
jgi:hypothetical protein